ncbi:MAG: phosphotransferase family protein [Candidatus Nanohaloarchaea archaeon]
MKEKIRGWIESRPESLGFESFELKSIVAGESNYNCFLETPGGKKVLRISRDVSRKNRLSNEYHTLKFLERENVDSVPQALKFSENTDFGDVLLETMVGTNDIGKEGFKPEILEALAREMAEIYSIPVERYRRFRDESYDKKRSLQEEYQEDFREFSRQPFQEYMEEVDEPDERITRFFRKQKDLVESIPDIMFERSLVHGDLGFNIRAAGDDVFIVDWEYSKLGCAESEIIYFFEHERLSDEQRKIFLQEFRKHYELDNVFELTREQFPKFIAFNDAIWAANRVEKEGKDEHQELLEDRLDYLEKLYDED